MQNMSLNKPILIFVFLLSGFFVSKAEALAGASFSLSPSSGVCIPGGTFDLDIILQSDEPSSGATAIINYDPIILEAETLSGGGIFPVPLIESIDPNGGQIRLDMGANFASPDFFSGTGTFGTIRFRVLQVGSASLSFDFTSGSTTDSNVAHADTHDDILTSTTGGSYTFEEGNTDPSLDPSCASGGGSTPTPTPTPTTPPGEPAPTPTPTPTTAPGGGATPTPTPTSAPAAGGGGAPEGGILGPTVFVSLLSLVMVGLGLILK